MSIDSQIEKLSSLLQGLLACDPIRFRDLKPTTLLPEAGVYRIFETSASPQETIYFGESSNLSNRIYRSHLMGNTSVSTLKNKLVKSGAFPGAHAVKEYLRKECSVQFIFVQDNTDRMRLKHFAIAVLEPKLND